MEARGSESGLLWPRRNPLADLTNASSLRSFTVKPNPKPKVSQEHSSTRSSVSSAGSSDPKNRGDHEPAKSTLSANGSSSISVSGVGSNKKSVVSSKRSSQSTVKLQYIEEKQKEKEKDVSDRAAFSCLPLGRTLTIWNNSMKKRGVTVQNEAYSDPCQKKKKKQRCVGPVGSKFSDEDFPLRNFIEKQRAYFEEVDKFELPEEVVSESELE